jgi:hypothetical protein
MVRRPQLVALLGLALAACSGAGEEQADPLPPMDRFYFPAGVAVSHLAGGGTALFVGSSNFDLRYSAPDGGALLSVDPDTSAYVPSPTVTAASVPLDVLGGQRIASYSGPIAVVDATTCTTLPAGAAPVVLIASRLEDVLYRFEIGPLGQLSCGAGCARSLDGAGPFDPFAITVACGASGRHAYVGFLRTPTSTRGVGDGAWIAEVDLDAPDAPVRFMEVGDGTVRSMAYEQAADRLWIAARSSGARTFLYSAVLSDPTWRGPSPWQAVDLVDLFPLARGSELRSLAVGTPTGVVGASRRIYATVRLYDVEAQDANSGNRPAGDVGGSLLVLDVTDDPDRGRPVVTLRDDVPLGTSVGDVAVVPRGAGLRDLVVATVLDGDLLYVYDDSDVHPGTVAQMVGHDATGLPRLGDRPMALAIDPVPVAGRVTGYVAAFGSNLVTRFTLDPTTPWAPLTLETIGGLAP